VVTKQTQLAAKQQRRVSQLKRRAGGGVNGKIRRILKKWFIHLWLEFKDFAKARGSIVLA
jgi:hypothetical protein